MGATTDTTSARAKARPTFQGWMARTINRHAISVAVLAPMTPSHVLFGLIDGASGVRPRRLPTAKAPTSWATVAITAPRKYATPLRPGKAKSSAANDPRNPTYMNAMSVTATLIAGRARTTPARYQSRVNMMNRVRTSGMASSPFQ